MVVLPGFFVEGFVEVPGKLGLHRETLSQTDRQTMQALVTVDSLCHTDKGPDTV